MPSLIVIAAAVSQMVAPTPAPDLAGFIDEAALKTGVPAVIIRAVMSTESAENLRAVSPKGALGLMQLMPATWEILRQQYGLGTDPFDPHDNILAGAFYLRALYDKYGPNGFLAAYNAGPGRWESHRDSGQSLPAETRAYITNIAQKLGSTLLIFAPVTQIPKQPSWMEAALFLSTDSPTGTEPTAFTSATSPFVSLPSPTPEAPQP
jgi:soluble lytic murein transglycosylase-like protein